MRNDHPGLKPLLFPSSALAARWEQLSKHRSSCSHVPWHFSSPECPLPPWTSLSLQSGASFDLRAKQALSLARGVQSLPILLRGQRGSCPWCVGLLVSPRPSASLVCDLDALSLVPGQPLFPRGVSRGAGFEFSVENGMKHFPLCTCQRRGLFATAKSSRFCLTSAERHFLLLLPRQGLCPLS